MTTEMINKFCKIYVRSEMVYISPKECYSCTVVAILHVLLNKNTFTKYNVECVFLKLGLSIHKMGIHLVRCGELYLCMYICMYG